MNLLRAANIAGKIIERLLPDCERIEVAGSIRRLRPVVGDVDLVILPKPGAQARIHAVFAGSPKWQVVVAGPQNCIYRSVCPALGDSYQVDVFFARPAERDLLAMKPGNFGTLLVCRTGSKEHNIFLIEHAKRRGLKWSPYEGVLDESGRCLASESEAEVFAALGLDFIAPKQRER